MMPLQTETVYLISQAPEWLVVPTAMVIVGVVMTFWLPRYRLGDGKDAAVRTVGPMILLISTVVFCMAVYAEFQQNERINDYNQGRYRLVSGCLDSFSPSTSKGHTPDVVTVDRTRLEYSDNEEDGGYHLTEISGGFVHADTWVRMYLMRDVLAMKDVIVRLDVRQHACPAAPAI